MRVTVISIDFSPRKSPERAISLSLFPSVPLTPARTNRIETLAPPEKREEDARHYLTYVVHGKRRQIQRAVFQRLSPATVFA